MASHFDVIEHVVKSQHTRDQPASVELGRENDHLRLHVKQYIPKATTTTKSGNGSVTIIGAHANAFPKEMYEPLWDELYESLQSSGCSIRSIWIADIASQGQSGVLNETLLGPNASWWDHGRDLLFLINQFQGEMPHPIIGIGHSVGASHISAHLSLLHPRLLQGMVLIDPIIQEDISVHTTFAQLSTGRRDTWPSREVAKSKFSSSGMCKSWDPRAFDMWMRYGLRDLPTEQHPGGAIAQGAQVPVTLTTTKAQEVYFYLQARYCDDRLLQHETASAGTARPDLAPFSRPETLELHQRLPELRPEVLYVFGSRSEVSDLERRDSKLARTGTGPAGSGGALQGKVKAALIDSGHLVAFEKPKECAAEAGAFIWERVAAWKRTDSEHRRTLSSMDRLQRTDINDLWKHHLGKL